MVATLKCRALAYMELSACCESQSNTVRILLLTLSSLSLMAEFVCRDLCPKSTVDGKGFCQLMSFLEPGYKVPSRPHLATTCRRLYTSLKEELLGFFVSP